MYEQLLTWLGDLKYFKWPMWLVYDPSSYKVRGEDVREVLGSVQPGDILLRGYDHYVDGLFIPGLFSHVGFYHGAARETDRALAGTAFASENPDKRRVAAEQIYRPGDQMVIHAMAEGVFMEDVLDFCRCDRMLILRLPEVIQRRGGAPREVPRTMRKAYLAEESAIYDRLQAGASVHRDEIIAVARKVALANLGKEYDFRFDFDSHKRFSCSEFVYYVYRCVNPFIQLHATTRRVLWVTRRVIEPDRFLEDNALELVWASRSCRDHERVLAAGRTPD